MNSTSFLQLLQGPFNFLRPDPEEVRRLMPDLQRVLLIPRPIFLEDETATPLQGFPVLLSPGLLELRAALAAYIAAEESVQLAGLKREAHDVRAHTQAWERYVSLLCAGGRERHHLQLRPAVPRRLLAPPFARPGAPAQGGAETHPQAGQRDRPAAWRRHQVPPARPPARPHPGDHLRPGAAGRRRHRGGRGGALPAPAQPPARQRPAVHRGPHRPRPRRAVELPRRLAPPRRPRPAPPARRARPLATSSSWRPTPGCAPPVVHLLRADPSDDGRELLARPGYVAFLATLKGYDPERLLPPPLVQVWGAPAGQAQGVRAGPRPAPDDRADRGPRRPDVRAGGGRAGAPGGAASCACRPPPGRSTSWSRGWSIRASERYGMIYDISDFSATLSLLHRAGSASQDGAFLAMFRFQRRIHRLALSHRAKLEKYLGDGAFYSSREATNLLLCSIQLQRYYVQAVRDGLPFDRGMRIALNFGPYRLIPMGGRPERGSATSSSAPAWSSCVAVTTGGAAQEVDEVKTMLLNQGYPEATAPLLRPLAQKERRRGRQEGGGAPLLRLHQPQRHAAQQRHGGHRSVPRPARPRARRHPPVPRPRGRPRLRRPSSPRTTASACRSASASSAWPISRGWSTSPSTRSSTPSTWRPRR